MDQTQHNITKVNAHIGISGNEIANQLLNEGTTHNKLVPKPHIHIAHTIPNWLNGIPTCKHQGEIYNLKTYINKCHYKIEL